MGLIVPLKTYLEIKKRYAFLHDENLGNFQQKEEGGIVVLTYGVGCYYHIFSLGFPRTFIIDWHCGTTLQYV